MSKREPSNVRNWTSGWRAPSEYRTNRLSRSGNRVGSLRLVSLGTGNYGCSIDIPFAQAWDKLSVSLVDIYPLRATNSEEPGKLYCLYTINDVVVPLPSIISNTQVLPGDVPGQPSLSAQPEEGGEPYTIGGKNITVHPSWNFLWIPQANNHTFLGIEILKDAIAPERLTFISTFPAVITIIFRND